MRYFPFDSQITGYDDNNNPIYDREANSDQLADWLAHYFRNGIFKDASGTLGFKTIPSSGMTISVKPGAAQINGRFCTETANTPFTISGVNAVSGRIDLVVLRLNLETSARNISLMVIEGTAAASPAAPYSSISRTSSIYDLVLAEIHVPAGTEEITTGMISDMRTRTITVDDTDLECCGVVDCPLTTFDYDDLYSECLSEFTSWFTTVQNLLASSDTTSIVLAITELQNTVNGTGQTTGLLERMTSAEQAITDNAESSFTMDTLWPGDPELVKAGTGCVRQSVVDRETANEYDAALIVFRKSTNNTTGNQLNLSFSKPSTAMLKDNVDYDHTCAMVLRKGEKSQIYMVDCYGRHMIRPVWWMTEDWQDVCSGTTAKQPNTLKKVADLAANETAMGSPFTNAFYFGDARYQTAGKAFKTAEPYYAYTRARGYYLNEANRNKNNDYNQFLIPLAIYGIKFPT